MFPRMRNRLKDRKKVKSLFQRSMCKKDCGPVSTLILTVAVYLTANVIMLSIFMLYNFPYYIT